MTEPAPSLPHDKTTAPDSQTTTSAGKSTGYRLLYVVGSWIAKAWRVGAYTIGSLVLILMLLLVGLSIWGSSSGYTSSSESYVFGSGVDKIAVIDFGGIVGGDGGSLLQAPSGITTESIRADLRQAGGDSAVKAVILHINSPGGSAVVSDEIYDLIINFKADYHKPVVSSFGDTAASGGYYIGAAADKIVANPATITGSIGVIMEYYNASGLMEKIGVSSEVIKSGAMKDIGSMSRQTTDQERAILQSVIDGAYNQFVDRVAAGRQMEREKVLELADGRIYTGNQAKDNGLVDEVGNLDKAISVASDLANVDQATVVRYSRGGWWDNLLSSASRLSPWYGLSEITNDYGLKGQLQYRWAL